MNKNYNKYDHEDWVIALWAGFFIMWFGVAFLGLAIGIVQGLMAAFK